MTHIIDRGADWFKSIGVPPDPKNPRDAGSYGPKLYCISGHVNKPGCVELPLGVTVRELVDKHGGGVWKGRKAKGCIPGGISMGLMTEAEFDTPLDFNGPGKVGCLGLGTAAVTVFDEETSIVDVLYNICRFFAHESCGQCTPCREGTGWMLKIVDRMRRGQGRLEDLKILDEVGDKHRHHAGHDDLRPGRRRRLAGEERRPQVPPGVRGVHQERAEGEGAAGAGGAIEASRERKRPEENVMRRIDVLAAIGVAGPAAGGLWAGDDLVPATAGGRARRHGRGDFKHGTGAGFAARRRLGSRNRRPRRRAGRSETDRHCTTQLHQADGPQARDLGLKDVQKDHAEAVSGDPGRGPTFSCPATLARRRPGPRAPSSRT